VRIHAFGVDARTDSAAQRFPALLWAGQAESAGKAQAAVDGDPGHHLGVDEMSAVAAHLPDAVVRLGPALLDVGHQSGEELPLARREGAALAGVEPGGVDHGAVDVELELPRGVVADAHRS
jgi:hypothetical protein